MLLPSRTLRHPKLFVFLLFCIKGSLSFLNPASVGGQTPSLHIMLLKLRDTWIKKKLQVHNSSRFQFTYVLRVPFFSKASLEVEDVSLPLPSSIISVSENGEGIWPFSTFPFWNSGLLCLGSGYSTLHTSHNLFLQPAWGEKSSHVLKGWNSDSEQLIRDHRGYEQLSQDWKPGIPDSKASTFTKTLCCRTFSGVIAS